MFYRTQEDKWQSTAVGPTNFMSYVRAVTVFEAPIRGLKKKIPRFPFGSDPTFKGEGEPPFKHDRYWSFHKSIPTWLDKEPQIVKLIENPNPRIVAYKIESHGRSGSTNGSRCVVVEAN